MGETTNLNWCSRRISEPPTELPMFGGVTNDKNPPYN